MPKKFHGGDKINRSRSNMNVEAAPTKSRHRGKGARRDKGTIKRLKMYKDRPVRDSHGKIKSVKFGSRDVPEAKIRANRKWFGNTRSITQTQMETFREELNEAVHNPYAVLLKSNKIPFSLLQDSDKKAKMNLLEVEPFEDVFGKKARRKRPKLLATDLLEVQTTADSAAGNYVESKDKDIVRENLDPVIGKREDIFEKGTSKRIWKELYKVIDSSDVLIEVLDARDPIGTRCKFLEEATKKDRPHKYIIILLNKIDLVPTWVTARWVRLLSKEFPTVAFHATLNSTPFGKGALIQLLRQFGTLYKDKKSISIGFFGYPNVGKSSVINTLKTKAVCKVAPIPGETKVWQYISLTKRIYLIDCPGVVIPDRRVDETNIVLKGVVQVEKLSDPTHHINEVLRRVKKQYVQNVYGIPDWTDDEDFLRKLARKSGKLLKGGEPDENAVAKRVLHDWQRGKLPFYTLPPDFDENKSLSVEQQIDPKLPSIVQDFQNVHVQPAFDKAELKETSALKALKNTTQQEQTAENGHDIEMPNYEEVVEGGDDDDNDEEENLEDYEVDDDMDVEEVGEDPEDNDEDEEAEEEEEEMDFEDLVQPSNKKAKATEPVKSAKKKKISARVNTRYPGEANASMKQSKTRKKKKKKIKHQTMVTKFGEGKEFEW